VHPAGVAEQDARRDPPDPDVRAGGQQLDHPQSGELRQDIRHLRGGQERRHPEPYVRGVRGQVLGVRAHLDLDAVRQLAEQLAALFVSDPDLHAFNLTGVIPARRAAPAGTATLVWTNEEVA
jgi:hypothetical protein